MIIDNGRATKRNNARKEEVYAYFLLRDVLFVGKKAIIGDNVIYHEPDIFSEDKKIGVEVMMCEPLETYLTDNKRMTGIAKNFDGNKNKFIKSRYDEHIKLSKGQRLARKMELKKGTVTRALKQREYQTILTESIDKKLSLYDSGHYDGCESVHLVVVSTLENKDYLNIKSIAKAYKNISLKYKKSFKSILFNLNDELYQINREGKFRKLYNNHEVRTLKQDLGYGR